MNADPMLNNALYMTLLGSVTRSVASTCLETCRNTSPLGGNLDRGIEGAYTSRARSADEVGHGGHEQPVAGGLGLGDGEVDGEAVELLDAGAVQRGVGDLRADVDGAVGALAADARGRQAPDDAEVLPVLDVDGRAERRGDGLAGGGGRGRAERADHRGGRGEGEEGRQGRGCERFYGDHFDDLGLSFWAI